MDVERTDAERVELIEYTIVSIEPTHERILPGACCRCVLVTEDLGRCGLETWIVARHLSRHAVEAPRKYLRVAHRVLGRWPRQPLHFRERQLRRLAGVQHAIRASLGGGATERVASPAFPVAAGPSRRSSRVPSPRPVPEKVLEEVVEVPDEPSRGEPEAADSPDDLTAISGIGVKSARILADAGITTFEQLAATSADALRELLERAGPRFRIVDPGTWQAKARTAKGDRG